MTGCDEIIAAILDAREFPAITAISWVRCPPRCGRLRFLWDCLYCFLQNFMFLFFRWLYVRQSGTSVSNAYLRSYDLCIVIFTMWVGVYTLSVFFLAEFWIRFIYTVFVMIWPIYVPTLGTVFHTFVCLKMPISNTTRAAYSKYHKSNKSVKCLYIIQNGGWYINFNFLLGLIPFV